MKHGIRAFLVVVCALSVSAFPVIEIRAADTDGGPTTRLQLLALPIVREIAVPDTTLYFMTPHCNRGTSPDARPPAETTQASRAVDNVDAKKTEESPKTSEIPSVTLYV